MTANLVLFNGVDASGNTGLWVTDGTSAGTWEISVAGSAFFNSVPAGPQYITAFGGEVLFEGEDPSHFEDLWVTDGTSPGTSEIPVPGVDFEFGLQPRWLTVFGSEVLFDGTQTNHIAGLWVTNGTLGGTSQISVPGANPNGLAPSDFTVFGSEVLFLGGGSGTGAANSGVWVTNGTSAGTSELSIAGAWYGGLFGAYPPAPNFAALGNKVLFEGEDAHTQPGLWVTDGTSAGTSEITLAGGFTSLRPTDLTTFGSEVLFNGESTFNGSGLWVTDGTAAGTSEITVANAAMSGVNPSSMTVFGSKVLFDGTDASNKSGLWVTDGTSGGTSEITVAKAGSNGLSPSNFVVFGTEVLFNGIDAAGHNGLWVTDGTPAGTSEITVAGVGASGLNPSRFATFSQTLARPALSNVPTNVAFTEHGAPVTVAPSLRVSDTNRATLSSATVSITGGTFANDGDVLSATTTGTSVTASYDSSTETLTLTGTGTLADYQAVLDSTTFVTPNFNPTNFGADPTRTLTWVVNDGAASNNLSTAQTATLSIAIVGGPPTLSGVAGSASFTEEGGAVNLSPSLTITDPQNAALNGATVSITGGTFFNDGNVLAANTAGTAITASYNSSTETLTLSGTDSLAHYQQALDTVTFSDGENPTDFGSKPTRTVTWVLNDGGSSNNLSAAQTTAISITNVNDPPQLNLPVANSRVFIHQTSRLAPIAGLKDPDNVTLSGATIAVTGGTFAGDGDVLAANTTSTNITASYNSTTETLTLTGTDTLNNYFGAILSTTFASGPNPTNFGSNPTRTITWVVNDGSASNNLSAPAATTISLSPAPRNDFDADGKSDILLQNADGTPQIWLMNGRFVTSTTSLLNPGPAWHVAASGDFNRDGTADLLWQNNDGLPSIWEMNGTSIIGGGLLPNPGPSWHIIATGDFYADGNTDILFQNTDGAAAIWEMNGTSVIGGGALPINPGPAWHVIGAGDFNGDGKADILWQNADGTPAIWEMNGTSVIGGGVLPNPGPSWHAIATGDFNGDGKADILWQNNDGTPAIWELNGTSIIGGGVLLNPGASWHVIGTSDFFGRGRADILWQNTDGTPAIWEMGGTSIIGGEVLPNPGAAWQVKDDGPIPADQMTMAPANNALPANGALHLSAPDSFAAAAAPELDDATAPKWPGTFLPPAASTLFRT